MRPKSLTAFFRSLLRFLIRQACGFTFSHFPDNDDRDISDPAERRRAEDAVEVEAFELKRRAS